MICFGVKSVQWGWRGGGTLTVYSTICTAKPCDTSSFKTLLYFYMWRAASSFNSPAPQAHPLPHPHCIYLLLLLLLLLFIPFFLPSSLPLLLLLLLLFLLLLISLFLPSSLLPSPRPPSPSSSVSISISGTVGSFAPNVGRGRVSGVLP